jgi:hypothetical protein
MREYWRDPGYWRWRTRWRKAARLLLGAFALAIGGFLGAILLTPAEQVVVSERLVTVVRTIGGKVQTVVETEVQSKTKTRTQTETGDTRLVTVTRDGKAVVLRVPGRTITDIETDTLRLPGKTKVVTNTRTNTETETQTQTNTVDRPVTTTERSTTTQTETRDVTGPERTVTDTETETQTETDTVTDTETVTETVTVTEPILPEP